MKQKMCTDLDYVDDHRIPSNDEMSRLISFICPLLLLTQQMSM